MRKIFVIIALVNALVFADDHCQKLYDMFMPVLEPQMTELCMAQFPNVVAYKFYINDGEKYTNMMLMLMSDTYYLYTEDDVNPFECTEKKIHITERPQDIIKTLLQPQQCDADFKAKIGMTAETKQ